MNKPNSGGYTSAAALLVVLEIRYNPHTGTIVYAVYCISETLAPLSSNPPTTIFSETSAIDNVYIVSFGNV